MGWNEITRRRHLAFRCNSQIGRSERIRGQAPTSQASFFAAYSLRRLLLRIVPGFALCAVLNPLLFSASLDAESLPSHVSYSSICCILDELESSGVELTFETNNIKQLENSAIERWKGKTFLFMKANNPSWLIPRGMEKPEQWLENPDPEQIMVEFQELTLGSHKFLISLFSTSPVTRTSAVWSHQADFRFSVQGDLLAVDPPSWPRTNYRLYFWNPTGSDLAIVDYNEKANEFLPVLAVVDSEGTFSDGSGDEPDIPLMRKQYSLDHRLRLFDHFTEFKREKGFLPAGQSFWHLGTRKDLHLIAYVFPEPSLPEEMKPYHWSTFFRGKIYTTAWIQEELP
ncbi:MAG: hypothetical protein KDK23_03040 [Leptospiraceae bacterium]|nr:hypothetical protein [Leptospiraceae bacterium]